MNLTKPITAFAAACFVTLMLFVSACQEEADESASINPANLLTKNTQTENIKALKDYQTRLSSIGKDADKLQKMSLNLGNSKFEKAAVASPQVIIQSLTSTPPLVNVKDSVAKLFDPDLQPCPIPEKILKKLKKFKEDRQAWVPKELANLLNGMPDQALYLKGTGLTVLLHTVKVKHTGGNTDTYIVVGSPTFATINLDDWLSKVSDNSFGYTLDCSGLMNATIDGTATVPGADIKSTAKAAMDKKTSMFIGAGVIISPLYAAYYGDASGVKLAKADRVAILSALINTPGITDADTIELLMSYEVIWSSSKGQQGFNGSADFSAKGGVGVGIVQASATGAVSGTVSRSSTFNAFDTYYTGRQRLNGPGNVSEASIKALIQQLNTH